MEESTNGEAFALLQTPTPKQSMQQVVLLHHFLAFAHPTFQALLPTHLRASV
jgi:hypothetical protein